MTASPPRILCIEDDPITWKLAKRLLEQAGCAMHWAEDGLAGFELALDLKPDLVLLDINLPGLSGFEIASKFRQHPDTAGIPLVALTSMTRKGDRETALVAGCDGFIPKPIDPFSFVRQVESYLGGRRERIEEASEGAALRRFNVQVVERLEAQLMASQESNRKLLEARETLEKRNRSLSRLLVLTRGILAERDPKALLRRILEETRADVRAGRLCAYRLHPSESYLGGLWWNGQEFEEAPALASAHPFLARLSQQPKGGILHGPRLRNSRIWDEGLRLGLWTPGTECCLLLLRDREDAGELWGFWAFEREESMPFQAAELEVMSLCASIAQVALEHAELIESLDESSRALSLSYERMEAAYQDLHKAKVDLSRRDRQVLLEELFFKITQRLESPVLSLHFQSLALEQLIHRHADVDPAGDMTRSVGEIREAVAKVDGLLKALLRRVGKEGTAPQWLDLCDLLQQELDLLQTEGAIPPGVELHLDMEVGRALIFGVYSDFAKLIAHLAEHALGGPSPSQVLRVRCREEDDRFLVELLDEGGPIPPTLLEGAFEPFSQLHHQAIIGVRAPGGNLPLCRQLLATYHGEIALRNEGEGTCTHVRVPLRA